MDFDLFGIFGEAPMLGWDCPVRFPKSLNKNGFLEQLEASLQTPLAVVVGGKWKLASRLSKISQSKSFLDFA